jgi:TDG/mug DNA glycosylase family protein
MHYRTTCARTCARSSAAPSQGNRSAEVRHYYARGGNEFWSLLFDAAIIAEPLTYAEDHRAPDFGVGLTDLAKYVSSGSDKGMEKHFDARAHLCRGS